MIKIKFYIADEKTPYAEITLEDTEKIELARKLLNNIERSFKMETYFESFNEIFDYVKANLSEIKNAPAIKLRKIQKEKDFSLADFIKVLQGFGIDKLNPQNQQEYENIFGTSDGFGGHIYSDNQRTE